ncbi:esterase/lipase family protein [Staphylococcus felis]|uniref:esterase/lipase family protein n=1 Tax=Staphylococcus felis TaxID=46127 RepID=UPI003967C0EE
MLDFRKKLTVFTSVTITSLAFLSFTHTSSVFADEATDSAVVQPQKSQAPTTESQNTESDNISTQMPQDMATENTESSSENIEAAGEATPVEENEATGEETTTEENEATEEETVTEGNEATEEETATEENEATEEETVTDGNEATEEETATEGNEATEEETTTEENEATEEETATEDNEATEEETTTENNEATEEETTTEENEATEEETATEDNEATEEETATEGNEATENNKMPEELKKEDKEAKAEPKTGEKSLLHDEKPTVPKGNQGHPKPTKYPTILVHGFAGFPDEKKPFFFPSYWGGNKVDLDKELKKQGYDVREAGMSAFGSDYDRAVELYYYIKGGRVDYGAYHAQKYGHERYGETFKGIYPEWEPGKKVHLIGHSLGGQTIQVLEDMLRNGVQEEIDYQKQHGGTIAPLFQGNFDNMVASVTSVATPHNGTYISDKLGNRPIVRKLFTDIVKYASNKHASIDYGYGIWGLKQRDDETYLQYLRRVRDSKVWQTEDSGFYDGSLEGSKRINDRLTLSDDVAYTSITGRDTHSTLSGNQRPNLHMFAPFKILSNLNGHQQPDSWKINDGPVPLGSGLYPYNKPHYDTTIDGTPKLGQWGVMPTLNNWDHMDFVGWDVLDTRIKPDMVLHFYEDIMNYLSSVEQVQEQKEKAKASA